MDEVTRSRALWAEVQALRQLGDALAWAAEQAQCECRASPCPLAVAVSRWRTIRLAKAVSVVVSTVPDR